MQLHRIVGSAALIGALAIVQGGLAAQQAPAPGGAPAAGRQGPPAGGRQGGGPPPAPQTGQSAAISDFTGYWVSVVNQDWFFRMITPAKGNYQQVPLNAAGRKAADEAFDPAQYGGDKYQTSGIIDCRAYGAAGLMHMPMRIHITWASANVLQIETDWGEQTRLINFDPARVRGDIEQAIRSGAIGPTPAAPSMQGYSLAIWEEPYRLNANQWTRGNAGGRGGGAGLNGSGGDLEQPGGNMAVLTTNLTSGWLRRNGVPYSARARMIEHFLAFQDPTGADWINVVTEVNDPEYLNTPFITSADFRKEPDGSKWAPHPCKKVG